MYHIRYHVLFAALCVSVKGHGRLIEPPSRSSMWRFGFVNAEKNTNDNAAFCGGFQTQWNKNGGKCGICGDPYNAPQIEKQNEKPYGKYAKGIIVKKYDVGQIIDVIADVTANHKGYFEYRLCQNDDVEAVLTQDCFDKHMLADVSGETKLQVGTTTGDVQHRVVLPAGIRCKDCVLQWRYTTANNWGINPATGKGCSGCGPQETFQACADIEIGSDDLKIGPIKPDIDIEVGEEDEREGEDEANEYDSDGHCLYSALVSPAMCHSLPVMSWSNRH